MIDNTTRMKMRYKQLKAEGICVSCTKKPAKPGFTMCEACLKRNQKYWNERVGGSERYNERAQKRIAAGLCVQCGKRPARPGLKSCEFCSERQRAYQLARQQKTAH